MALEELHGAFVFLRRGASLESAEISPALRPRVHLAGIQPIPTGGKLADHGRFPGGTSEYIISSRDPAMDQSQRKA
jgi:hypothetical protein